MQGAAHSFNLRQFCTSFAKRLTVANNNPYKHLASRAIVSARSKKMKATSPLPCALILMLLTVPAFGGDWANWLGPTHNGVSDETWSGKWGAAGPKRLWKANVGLGYASVTIANDRAYTLGYKGDSETVYCFSAASGKPLWSHTYKAKKMANAHRGGPNATITVHDGLLYSISKDGQLFCFKEGDTKSVVWSKSMRTVLGVRHEAWGYACSPLIHGKQLILHAGGTTSLNRKTGKTLWRSAKSYKAGYATPTPFKYKNRELLACFNAHGIVIQDAANGREYANFAFKEKSYGVNAVSPIITGPANDHIFVSCGYNGHAALVKFNGKSLIQVWDNKNLRNHMNNCVLIDGYLYGFDGNAGRGKFVCMLLSDGKVMWTQSGLGCGALIASQDKKLVIMSEKGKLVIADPSPKQFVEIATAKAFGGTCWVQPTLAHGRLYCRNNDGAVICFDVSGK
jgi:outer membrane protein assembly factor BamB